MKAFIDTNLFIYLNIMRSAYRRVYEEFYERVIEEYTAYTNVLVLDELLYVSYRRYKVPYNITLEFIDEVILPYVNILGIGLDEYKVARNILLEYGIKPSDTLHAASCINNKIKLIVSEDRDFDKIPHIKRIWLNNAY